MFAIIRQDGRQYLVSKGDTVRLDRINSETGGVFETNEVLAISEKKGELSFGEPILKDAKVVGKILRHGKDRKIIVFKRKRRKTYRRKYGHRQLHTIVKIESISSKSSPKKILKSDKDFQETESNKIVKSNKKSLKSEKSVSKTVTDQKINKKKVKAVNSTNQNL